MQSNSDVKALVLTCLVYLCSLVGVLAWDRVMNGTITGRGLAASIAIAIICTVWWEYRRRRIERERSKDDRLRRRGLFHKNGGERGEVEESCGLVILVCLVALALLAATINFCAAAEPDEPALIDAVLVEISDQLWPAVPLKSQELFELQYVTMKLGLLHKATEDTPPNMPGPVSEKRAALRRVLKKVHADLVEIQIAQAGSVVQASRDRKGGAR
jgi:hypothetical protein